MQPPGKITLFIGLNDDPKGCPHEPAVPADSWNPLSKVILYFPRVDAGGEILAGVSIMFRESKPFPHKLTDTLLGILQDTKLTSK